MGLYINPPDMSKEKFLAVYGSPISIKQAKEHDAGEDNKFVVCLVDNFAFTAASIADTDRKRDAFLYPDDRPKKWFLVDKEVLKPYM